MKGTVQRKALLELLAKVKAGAGKDDGPMGMVLIEGSKGKLTLTAFNGEAYIAGDCKATLTKNGAMCVPPKGLEGFLKAVTVGSVSLSVKGQGRTEQVQHGTSGPPDFEPQYQPVQIYHGELRVQAGVAATVLTGRNPKDFPKAPKMPKSEPVKLTDLGNGIGKVDHAMATEDSRPVLNALCINPGKKSSVDLIATDGWRLTVATAKSRGTLKKQVLVPRGATMLLKKLMPGKVSMRVKDKYAFFEGDGLTMTVVLTPGTYPKYEQLIPSGGTSLKVQSAELMAAIKTVEATEPDSGIIRLQTKGKMLRVFGRMNGNETEYKIPCSGKAQIAFNCRYLKDLVARTPGVLVMRTTTTNRVAVVKHNGTLHLLMPMYVAE